MPKKNMKDLFPAPPKSAGADPDALHGALGHVAALLPLLPEQELTPGQWRQLRGYLFPEGPLFVHTVAQVLSQYPDVYSDVADDPGELELGETRAQAYFRLYYLLNELAHRALAHAHLEDALAVRRALQIVRHMRLEPDDPLATPRDRERADLMSGAEYILSFARGHKKVK